MVLNALDLLHNELPLHAQPFALPPYKRPGLVIVDEVKGFCSVGCGNLAPTSHNQQIALMVDETDKLAREFSNRGLPMLVLLDTHDPNKPEPPYPPHCLEGSGEEELVPALQWLNHDKNVTLLRKDCINGFVGGVQKDGTNVVVDWVKSKEVEMMLVVGICTDICVLDFVVTVLSARNHGILPPLEEVMVYSEACSTYDLPKAVAEGMPGALAHPQGVAHHMGLYMAKSRGAHIVNKIIFADPNFRS